jgi:hypothetical protein
MSKPRPPRSGPRIWAPRPGMTRAPSIEVIDRYADRLVAALREQGPLDTGSLRAQVGARYWGPGVFGAALRRGRDQGRIRRTGYRRYAAD